MKRFLHKLSSSSNKFKARWEDDHTSSSRELKFKLNLKEELDHLLEQRYLDENGITRAIRLCEDAKSAEHLRQVHKHILKNGSFPSTYLGNLMVRAYGKCKSPWDAQTAFDEITLKNEFSWGCLITAYAQNGECSEALQVSEKMDVKLNAVISATVIGICSTLGDLRRGKAVHDRMLRTKGFKWDVVLENALLSMYARCRSVDGALAVFERMKDRTVVSWNAMLAAYTQNGRWQEAIDLYHAMCKEVQPNDITFTTVLVACGEIEAIDHGREVHSRLRGSPSESDVTVLNALVTMYGKCACIDEALDVFRGMSTKNVCTWSAIIGAVGETSGTSREAIRLYWGMQLEGVPPNAFTFANVLRACLYGRHLRAGMNIHYHLVQAGYGFSVTLGTTLVALYVNTGLYDYAKQVFEAIQGRDSTCWAVYILAHARLGFKAEVIELFRRMKAENVAPTSLIYATVLAACTSLNAFAEGKAVHEESTAANQCGNVVYGSSLVNMYSKCGNVEEAKYVFDGMEYKDNATWTSLIMGYARHGSPEVAIQLYEEMQLEGVYPNEITVTAVLHACNHGGLHLKAREYFVTMVDDYGTVEVELEHYAVMVDLLARLGRLNDAEELILCMPFEPSKPFWSSLLSACRLHKDVLRAKRISELASKLAPDDPSSMVQLSNVHASTGDFIGMANVRKGMLQRGLKKRPGCSSIEVGSKTYEFAVGGDASYPRYDEMLDVLRNLSERIKDAGYVPEVSEVLHDIRDDEKELLLCLHSEKLAVSFGLLSTPPGTTLRIFNTLRICSDCHSAAKFISKVVSREIVIREPNRSHTFSDGLCNCGDYW